LQRDIILITSDGDRPTPSSYQAETVKLILQCEKIVAWKTQNYDGTIKDSKIGFYPIGLDLHSRQELISCKEQIQYLLNDPETISHRSTSHVFCDAHLNARTHPSRKQLKPVLGKNERIVFLPRRVDWRELIQHYRRYKFIISPPGAGLDCHRHWEAMLVGCIIITLKGPLDDLWATHDLPVVTLGCWEELNTDTERKLGLWLRKFEHLNPKSLRPKFKSTFWMTYGL